MSVDFSRNTVVSLELSLAHVAPHDCDLLDNTPLFIHHDYQYGFYVLVPYEPTDSTWVEARLLGFSDAFISALRAAAEWFDAQGKYTTRWIKFDKDAPETPGLPKP